MNDHVAAFGFVIALTFSHAVAMVIGMFLAAVGSAAKSCEFDQAMDATDLDSACDEESLIDTKTFLVKAK